MTFFLSFFLFFFWVNKHCIRKENILQLTPSRGKENKRWCTTTTSRRRGRREKNENVVRVKSSRGPIHHMMGVEVSNSINIPCHPRRGAVAEPGCGPMGGIFFLMNKKLKLIKY
jgi:hypothetical protein